MKDPGNGMHPGWKVLRFGDVAEIANGQVQPTEEPYASYLHIGPENIESGSGRLHDLRTAREEGLVSGKYLFDETSVVYSKVRPNLNKVCRPDFVGVCSADAYPIWPRRGVVTKDFLYYVMSSPAFVRQATEVSARSGMPKINRRDLCLVRVLVPPLREQAMIARLLDGFSAAHEIQIRLIEARSRLGKSLARKVLCGHRGVRTCHHDKEGNCRQLGFRQSNWSNTQVKDIAEEVSERNIGRAEFPVLSCTKHHGLVLSLEYFGKRVFATDTANYKVVRRGQFAYATNHVEEGSIGLLDSPDVGLISPIYTVFRVDSNRVHAPYLYRLFKTEAYRHIFEVNTNASVDRRGSLRWSQFAKIHVPLPSFEEQRRISGLLDRVDREIDLLTRQAEALARQKKGLMEKVLAGQLRVCQ